MKTSDHEHKTWVGQVFDRTAAEYGMQSTSFFQYFGKRLVEQVPIVPGQHSLDVATGKGAILFPLAEQITPQGKVVGIDISEQMLAETAVIAQKKGMDWVELLPMDAEHLHFPNHSFDHLFCGFALFFFPSLSKALAEFKRVLKPGGTLAVSTWGEDSELDALVHGEIQQFVNTPSLILNPLWSSEVLYQALDEAGLNNIRIIEETEEFIYPTPEEWWNSLWSLATRAKLECLSPQQLALLRARLMEKAIQLDKGQGLIENLQVFYGIAKK